MNEVLYTTEDLSKMFRVGKSTIKRWTDEGKLQCFKTPGGHRKFKPSNVHEFIQQYHYEIVTPLLPFSRTSEQISANAVTIGGSVTIEECFSNAIKGKRQQIEQSFSAVYSQGKTLPNIFDSFLTPMLRLIHNRHQQQLISSVEFQIAKNTLIHALINFTESVPKAEKNGNELYCISVQEGINEVELKAVELLLDNAGMTVFNLGTVLTQYAASDIVNQCKPDDVFVVLSLDHSSVEIIQQFDALTSGVKSYGGNVYMSSFFEERREGETVHADVRQMYSFSEIMEQLTQPVIAA
ncbi:MAG: helix-turn-helix domain-containing protein [Bacteroidota bacterium]|jgi:excisionase family DNA binding protein